MMLEMSEREFNEWIEYSTLDPFGNERFDIGIARICALLATIHGSDRKKPPKISDFMWDYTKPPEPEPKMTVSAYLKAHSKKT